MDLMKSKMSPSKSSRLMAPDEMSFPGTAQHVCFRLLIVPRDLKVTQLSFLQRVLDTLMPLQVSAASLEAAMLV